MSEPSARIPRHVAIIMDGNGRWAKKRGLPRAFGHREGAEALRRAVEAAGDLGVEHLTVYAFSSENWKRAEEEVSELMGLLRRYLATETAELHKRGIRFSVIGDRDRLAPDIAEAISAAEALTADNAKGHLTLALSYGARDEILRAARKLAASGETIDEASFSAALDTAGTPDPDLVIRTSGEQRLSNFLLWQCAYAEFWFTDLLWPDFDKAEFARALDAYAGRDRRYGGRVASG
jgi:undecaprenyl diphosphate synthase